MTQNSSYMNIFFKNWEKMIEIDITKIIINTLKFTRKVF